MATNFQIPVNDSRERREELLEGVGLNKSLINHCLKSKEYAPEEKNKDKADLVIKAKY